MSYYAISEPAYKTSNWYSNIMDGLIEEKRQKRFSLIMLDNISELKKHTITDEDVIFVIGTNSDWLSKVIQMCESRFNNRIVMLGNHENKLCKGKYSIVTSDIARDIQVLYNYLTSYGKNRVALYGINPESSSDAFRKESFLSCGADKDDIFYNTGSLSKCYEDFLDRIHKYDAVICANDYAAISLVRFMKDDRTLFVTSCGGGALLTHFFSPSITHTWVDYQSFGKAGLDLCRILQKNKNVNSVNIYLSSNFSIGETTNNLPLLEESVLETDTIQKAHDKFYSDLEIDEMLRIETLLISCDEDDFLILDYLLNNMTYTQIAEKMFMSTNGVKYKLKNMFQTCHVASKNDFVELLNKYIQNS